MLSKLTLETKAKEIINQPLFKEYMQVAKQDDNFRRLRAPQLTMRVPNSTLQESLIIELSQDGKHINLKEKSDGIIHIVGYYPLNYFQEAKQVAKKTESAKEHAKKESVKKTTTKRKYTRKTTAKRTSRKKAE